MLQEIIPKPNLGPCVLDGRELGEFKTEGRKAIIDDIRVYITISTTRLNIKR